ncbi:MAG: hypothetical protein CML68_20370 [Rhodobacteraceae bacterium]|nr:hypothetical protein [Paracoccaceae bacterium]
MSGYTEDYIKPVRRAIILAFLEASKGHVSNADILMRVINRTKDGFTAYYSEAVEDLRWLEARGYVTITGDTTVVATATPAGRRIARGENIDAGISRDIPEV